VPDELISTHERKHVPACLKAKTTSGWNWKSFSLWTSERVKANTRKL